MKNNRIKSGGFSNFGFSTIVFSFVMICVVTFSVLSLATANSDYKLSKKAAQKNLAYYAAEEAAYAHINALETQLAETFFAAEDYEEYYTLLSSMDFADGTYDTEQFYYHFTVPVDESQNLNVTLQIQYPIELTDTFYRIITWQSVYDQVLVEDEILDLWD